ncbi:MAG: ATP-binding protein [Candidatus Poribacteria bacterium]|nr:ATP-binding protein [Candidatus Poribacteria bacterium]
MRRYRIQNKIVLPFILLFTVVVLVVPLITIMLFDRKYDEQFSLETQEWLKVIVSTTYIHDPQKVKEAYGAEVMIVGVDNTINSSTLEGDWSTFSAEMKFPEARERIEASNGEFVLQNVKVGGRLYKVIYYPQKARRLYCLMRPMAKIADAKRQATLWMLGIAPVVILLVALISHLIGKNLADPIKELVQFTRRVAEGNLKGQCKVKTHDEIGDLTIAFNQMTRDLRNSRNELIQAERLATAGKMAASFAHEIRNPLSSMRMLAQMLMRKKELPESRRAQSMRYILEEIERIDVMVKGWMDFARPAALDLAPNNLNQALQEVLDLMEANLSHHQILLLKKFDANLPPVPFDRDKLKQAFMNIVLNATDAMPEGGTLELSTMQDSDWVRIDLLDTGVGIPPENLNRLFEPFFTTKPQGTGLGLANAKRVLEQHGGDIQMESVVGKGTTVSLWLPLTTANTILT